MNSAQASASYKNFRCPKMKRERGDDDSNTKKGDIWSSHIPIQNYFFSISQYTACTLDSMKFRSLRPIKNDERSHGQKNFMT